MVLIIPVKGLEMCQNLKWYLFHLKNINQKIAFNQIVDTIFSSSSFLSFWPRDHLAWPIGFVSLSKAEISFVKVLLRSNSDKSSRVKFNSYEQQPSQQQSIPKLLGPLCGKLQYISESTEVLLLFHLIWTHWKGIDPWNKTEKFWNGLR